ncbi:DUF732 domain-containing protein [Corynebacterium freiburgense]|uniref:DUF732 domain-containing protein n=1 Tax=Corynebacterium freiburgense TaxID=556548 RepID=UPI0003FFBDA5|nr:DUF732 domain-containing protein [Corynebacterium freiburgense]WJZ03864.1 hypothetical protein CFREI_13050 [Corynebacterium freiburgense]
MTKRFAIVVIAAAGLLAACGGATSDETTSASSTTLSRASTKPSASSSVPDESKDSSAQSSEPSVQDRAAQEISSLPEITPERSSEDKDYLGTLKDKNVKVEGIEDQLIAAATEVCRANELGQQSFTVDAVAGQLIEQGRSSQSPEEVAKIIADAAKSAYC